MVQDSTDRPELLNAVFDAIPSPIFVVDADVRIQAHNAAAAEFLTGQSAAVLRRRFGDVLYCLNSTETTEGCGHSELCRSCVIRKAVGDALSGDRVVRRRLIVEVVRGTVVQEIYALITASRFQFGGSAVVLLVVEDISEIAELRRIVPICSLCKEVQDEKEAWGRVEAYFGEHWGLEFSHGYCPQCYEKEMAKLDGFGEEL